MIVDTLNNVANGLAYIQDLSIVQDEKYAISTPGSVGYYCFLETLRAALQFEVNIEAEEKQWKLNATTFN